MKQSEVDAAIIADPQVARNNAQECGETLLKIYDDLKGCRDGFTAAVAKFREVQEFDKHLLAVIKFSLPKELKAVRIDGIDDVKLTDEEYAKQLAKVTEARHNVGRMGVLVQIAKLLDGDLTSLRSKEAKLSERIKLQNNGTAEWQVAVRRRIAVRDSIGVMERRKFDIAERFFNVRHMVVEEMLRASRSFDQQFEVYGDKMGKREDDYIEAMMHNDDKSLLEELAGIRDYVLTKSGRKA